MQNVLKSVILLTKEHVTVVKGQILNGGMTNLRRTLI